MVENAPPVVPQFRRELAQQRVPFVLGRQAPTLEGPVGPSPRTIGPQVPEEVLQPVDHVQAGVVRQDLLHLHALLGLEIPRPMARTVLGSSSRCRATASTL